MRRIKIGLVIMIVALLLLGMVDMSAGQTTPTPIFPNHTSTPDGRYIDNRTCSLECYAQMLTRISSYWIQGDTEPNTLVTAGLVAGVVLVAGSTAGIGIVAGGMLMTFTYGVLWWLEVLPVWPLAIMVIIVMGLLAGRFFDMVR